MPVRRYTHLCRTYRQVLKSKVMHLLRIEFVSYSRRLVLFARFLDFFVSVTSRIASAVCSSHRSLGSAVLSRAAFAVFFCWCYCRRIVGILHPPLLGLLYCRSGAVLKIEVWDWDRSSSDDPLGHFEVSIGEELLSQQVIASAALT